MGEKTHPDVHCIYTDVFSVYTLRWIRKREKIPFFNLSAEINLIEGWIYIQGPGGG